MADNKAGKVRWVRGVLCTGIAIAGTGYAYYLRSSHLVETDATFFGFTCLFIFAGIVVYELPRILEFSLKEGSVKMAEVKEAEQRIYAQVDTVKKLSMALADILVMQSLNVGRLSAEEHIKTISDWQAAQLENILRLVDAAPEDKERLERFPRLFADVDALSSELLKEGQSEERDKTINQIKQAWRKVHDEIRRDTLRLQRSRD